MDKAEIIYPNRITDHFNWLRGDEPFPFIWISEDIETIRHRLNLAYGDAEHDLLERADLIATANSGLNLNAARGQVIRVWQVENDPEVYVLEVKRDTGGIRAIMLEKTLLRAQ